MVLCESLVLSSMLKRKKGSYFVLLYYSMFLTCACRMKQLAANIDKAAPSSIKEDGAKRTGHIDMLNSSPGRSRSKKTPEIFKTNTTSKSSSIDLVVNSIAGTKCDYSDANIVHSNFELNIPRQHDSIETSMPSMSILPLSASTTSSKYLLILLFCHRQS